MSRAVCGCAAGGDFVMVAAGTNLVLEVAVHRHKRFECGQGFTPPKPHDCAFLASPLGEKYCHYERRVETSTEKVCPAGYTLTSADSCYDSSYMLGKGATVAPHEKVTAVSVWWEHEED
jgi:hypothetical protein